MVNSIQGKFLSLIKAGTFETAAIASCEFVQEVFVPIGEIESETGYCAMRDTLYKVLMEGSHPTLNPFLDNLFENKEEHKTLKDALLPFIKKNAKCSNHKCDLQNDVMRLTINLDLLVINCLPFFDQEEIVMTKASVQTALFKYDIEE